MMLNRAAMSSAVIRFSRIPIQRASSKYISRCGAESSKHLVGSEAVGVGEQGEVAPYTAFGSSASGP